jgi:phosphoribosylanthranilate isomerase
LPVGLPGTGAPEPKVPPPEDHPILHLDALGDPMSDGSAHRPDWEVCHRLVEANPGRKVLLAGGLDRGAVEPALAEVRPWGLDFFVGPGAGPASVPDRIGGILDAVNQAESRLA